MTVFSNKLKSLEGLHSDQRLKILLTTSSKQRIAFFVRQRYIALILLINLPGNIVIGGGGGIAVIAGFSGIFKLSGFLIAISIAVAPVPMAFLYLGDSPFK
ncbi:MAG: hypothetical protein ACI9J2_002531 [Saprospiraceae bacterium]